MLSNKATKTMSPCTSQPPSEVVHLELVICVLHRYLSAVLTMSTNRTKNVFLKMIKCQILLKNRVLCHIKSFFFFLRALSNVQIDTNVSPIVLKVEQEANAVKDLSKTPTTWYQTFRKTFSKFVKQRAGDKRIPNYYNRYRFHRW